MKKLPIFNAVISDEESGMVTISLVDYPATESDFVAFAKEDELVRLPILRKGLSGDWSWRLIC